MASFLYYFPGESKIANYEQIPKKCGLTHLEGASLGYRLIENKGPDGKSGCVVSANPEATGGVLAAIGYWPDKQEWEAVTQIVEGVENVTHWIGWEKESRPTPEDVGRKDQVQGSLIAMAGHSWELACVHAPMHSLPTRYTRKPSGWREEVVEEYAALVDEAARFRRAWFEPKTGEQGEKIFPTNDEICSFVCRMLGVNYRLGEWECGFLGLADSRYWTQVLKIAWGITAVEEEESSKKKDDTQGNT